MIDLHVHTCYSGHGKGEIDEYLQKAQELKLREIGISEHFPMEQYWKNMPGFTMSIKHWPEFLQSILKLKQEYPFLRFGLEIDYFPEAEDAIKKLTRNLPVDYLIGSVHFINDWPFDSPFEIDKYKLLDLRQLTKSYFILVKKVIRSGTFNILGHLDLIKKFGFINYEFIEPYIQEILQEIKNSGMVLEVNTAGFRYPAGEQYPSTVIIKEAVREKIPLTTGSDAHKPEQLAFKFKEIYQMLTEIGVKTLTSFDNRLAKEIPLNRP